MIYFKNKREQAGLTQAKLAEKLNVSQSTVALWETGRRMPHSSKLVKIAEVLACTVGELFENNPQECDLKETDEICQAGEPSKK